MEKWFVTNKKADFDEMAKIYGISPILARILRNRDLTENREIRAFLDGDLGDCHNPLLMLDMDKARRRLWKAVQNGETIRVMGDYDVDGVSSTYILVEGLKRIGAKVDGVIPHRIHDGYGLNDSMIEEAGNAGVQVILTCDNGISAKQQVELANSLGMEVIVTDHHEVPFEIEGDVKKELLPPAFAVVDPKREGDTYPFSGICGGLVAYKLIQTLYALVKEEEEELWQGSACEDTLEAFVEIAALATVCDVMELKDENRIIVKEGLKRMRETSNLGIKSLLEVNGVEAGKLSVFHLGFVIGPCLNASGRLDSAKNALELLQAKNQKDAMELAQWLKDLNDSRKNKTLLGEKQAIQMIEEQELWKQKVLVVFLEDVHESLAGIIAGRIRERYCRPTFVLTMGEEGVKGSGRSIDAYHMYEGLVQVKEFLTKFGGHKLAAGLSLPQENVETFRQALNDTCALSEEDFYEKVSIDIPMPLVYGSLELAKELEKLEPFGVGNPKPLFAQKGVKLIRTVIFGKNRNVLRLLVRTPEEKDIELIYFGGPDKFFQGLCEKYGEQAKEDTLQGIGEYDISVAYLLNVNTYQGRVSLQYELKYFC